MLKRSQKALTERIESGWYDTATAPEKRGPCLIINNLNHDIVKDYRDLFSDVLEKMEGKEWRNDSMILEITSMINTGSDHFLYNEFDKLIKMITTLGLNDLSLDEQTSVTNNSHDDQIKELTTSGDTVFYNNQANELNNSLDLKRERPAKNLRDDQIKELTTSSDTFIKLIEKYQFEKETEIRSYVKNCSDKSNDENKEVINITKQFFAKWVQLITEKIGSLIDTYTILKTFSELKYDVQIKYNLNKAGMKRAIQEIGNENPIEFQYDSVVIHILSHGDSNIVCDYNYKNLRVAKIVKFLSSKDNTAFRDKPKLLFISACRGEKGDKGHEICLGKVGDEMKIPLTLDFFMAFGCFNGYKFQISTSGTPFIQCLCNILEQGPEESITTLMPFVNQDVQEMISDRPIYYSYIDVVTFESSLSKQFRFRNRIE